MSSVGIAMCETSLYESLYNIYIESPVEPPILFYLGPRHAINEFNVIFKF